MIKNRKINECLICKSNYYIRVDRAAVSKYCSRICWNKRRKKLKCEVCGKEIESYDAKRFCSSPCQWKKLRGIHATAYKDGKSLQRDRARAGNNLKKWRESIFKRDKYICQKCGIKGMLHAHHIIEWAKDKSKRFDIDNGITLCIDCHGKIHGKNFRNRIKKKCPDCDKYIKRVSKRCRRCATINQWKRHKALNIVK